jgi:putative spermidine/putrescine transport system permease protein
MTGTDTDTRSHGSASVRVRRIGGLVATITAPLTWLGVIYLGSLVLLVISAFYKLDEFTGKASGEFTTDNITTGFTRSVYRTLIGKSILVAAAVTVLCLVIAVPVAFYVSRIARPWAKRGLMVAFLLPLWSGYLVKAYALRAIFEPGSKFGDGGFLKSVIGWSPGFGYVAVILTLTYLWLPYMLLPIYAGLERLPDSLIDASSDLGAGSFRTFRSVIMPMIIPALFG